jgi:hypothetical protein
MVGMRIVGLLLGVVAFFSLWGFLAFGIGPVRGSSVIFVLLLAAFFLGQRKRSSA